MKHIAKITLEETENKDKVAYAIETLQGFRNTYVKGNHIEYLKVYVGNLYIGIWDVEKAAFEKGK